MSIAAAPRAIRRRLTVSVAVSVMVGVVLACAAVATAGVATAAPATVPAASRASTASAASTHVAVPKTPGGLPRAIEDPASYIPEDSCTPNFRPGTWALGRLLVKTYPDSRFGGKYVCGTDGVISEHYDGRALDWFNSVHIPHQKAEVQAVLKWLLATDSHGNAFAMARRLGVMYLIWNNRIWSSDDNTWLPYLNCAATTKAAQDSVCHRNHLHISLDWNGAMARTSFFTKHLEPPTDFGPCRVSGLTWAAAYHGYNPRPCPRVAGVTVPARSSAVMANLVAYSGILLQHGTAGPAVLAVQNALKAEPTGAYDANTLAQVERFQKAHHLKPANHVTQDTWRALLRAHTPH